MVGKGEGLLMVGREEDHRRHNEHQSGGQDRGERQHWSSSTLRLGLVEMVIGGFYPLILRR